MRFGFRGRVVVLAAVAYAVVGFGAGSASRASAAGQTWGSGVEAVLPANAAPTDQVADVSSVSCPAAGNCSAIGNYVDNSGKSQGQLLNESNGSWSVGVEATVPPNASPETPEVLLGTVSCSSPGNCSAVGTYCASAECTSYRDTPPSGDIEGLLLSETDGSWSAAVEASLPANATATDQNVVLASVSCASAGNCSAVGSYIDDSGAVQGLVLTESAGSWATGVEVGLPANAVAGNTFLDSVSCASVGSCSAVGGYINSSFGSDGLLLTETGGNWATGVEVPVPGNALALREVSLTSVSCASVGNCSAVGSYLDSSHESQGLLLTETAGAWGTADEAALPATAMTADVSLGSVSCASAGNCSAVGYFDEGGEFEGLALSETAGTWATGVEPRLPANAGGNRVSSLASVSCPSAGNCAAIGSYSDNSSNNQGLLLTETAGNWNTGAEVALPADANAAMETQSVEIYSVSCAAAGSCTAGGSYTDTSRRGQGDGQSGLLVGGSPPTIELHISEYGTGAGTVSSLPAGINCGVTCSASFDAGTSLTLSANPSPGSGFSGWSGAGCSATRNCQINTGISEQTLTATFTRLSKCVVPKVRGKRLGTAKHAIRTHNCALGEITHAASQTIKEGRVISQKPRPGSRLKHGARVSLVVSAGKLKGKR